jgi:hypothetical protein
MKRINETQFGKGAIKQSSDSRDYVYNEEFIGGALNINWVEGFDIRKEMGGDIEYLNQMSSYSCGGCALAYQVWVYQVIELMNKYQCDLRDLRINYTSEVEKISFKQIYSQVALGMYGGSTARDLGKHIVNRGALFDRDCASMKPNGTTDELWVNNKDWITPELTEKAMILSGKDYRFIDIGSNMDIIANAIKENKGVVFGVNGINNGTWTSERPQPPTLADWTMRQSEIWGHFIWLGAYGQDSYGKFVATPNSWYPLNFQNGLNWTITKPNGYGWQKLYQNYFDKINASSGFYTNTFNPMTFTDKLNDTNMKFLKEKNKPAIYLIVGNKKIMIVDMPTLTALNEAYEEVDSLSQYTNGGTIVWVERIIN